MIKTKRIDRISSFKGFVIFTGIFAIYLFLSEVVLNVFDTRDVLNDFEYYASKTFTEEQWSDAEKFRRDIISIGQRGVLIKDSIVYRYKPAQSETVNFNSLGFRGKEVSPRIEGEIRIVVLGASRIWGNYLPDEKTIPVLIEKDLSTRFPNRKITVFNLGIEGSDLQRGVETAKMFQEALDPDIVLFYYGFSDMNYAYLHGNIEWIPFNSDSPMDDETFKRVVGLMFPKGWLQKRKLYNLIIHSVKGEIAGTFFLKGENREYADIPDLQSETAEKFHDRFFNRIESAAQYFKGKGIDSILVLPPVPQTKEPLSDLEKEMTLHYETVLPGYDRYIKRCTANVLKIMNEKKKSFLFVDQSDIFDGDPGIVFFDGMHFTPDACAKTAAGISEILSGFLNKNRAGD
ncbi:MAG TPA: hypothetical protein VLJ60_04585 [bacterium]|nr:hypothetical protein [bacterium]